MKAITTRRSIRKYKEKDVDYNTIKQVLNAARWAPSASNTQPWEFIVIREDETKKDFADIKGQKFIADAPVLIAFVTDPDTSRFHKIDGALATQNFQLMAWELGLGTCWIGTFNREKAKTLFDIPKEKHLLTVMPLGYPAEEGHSTRVPLEHITYRERYGRQWK